MTGLREAAQMALEALQESKPIDIDDPAAFYRSAHAIEALRVALENEFNPDWDAMAVMVEEQQRMAKRIEELKERLLQVELNPPTARLAQPEQEPTRSQKMRDAGITRRPKGWDKEQELEGINEVILNSIRDSSEIVAPPQREWQGLTDEERQECLYSDPIFGMAASTFAHAIEAKLKEKNGAT